MLLAIDIGNSSVSFGLFTKVDGRPELVVASKVAALKNRSSDEYAVLIKQILDLRLDGKEYTIDSAAIASVVPSLTPSVSAAAEYFTGTTPFTICPGIKTGFKIGINDPSSLGADIVANVAGAATVMKPPFVIYDSGTATTFTVVDSAMTVIGTAIMPGVKISANALTENAELLELATVSSDNLPLIGKDTDEAIRSGLILGSSMALDGFVRNTREMLICKNSDQKLGLVATGGFSGIITPHCRNKFTLDQNLTLRGIAVLYYLNISK